jgi:hypothetical protein
VSSEVRWSATVDAPPAEEPIRAAAAIDPQTVANTESVSLTLPYASVAPLATAAAGASLQVPEAAVAVAEGATAAAGVYPAADTTAALPASVSAAAAATPVLCAYKYTETDIRPMRVM